MQNFEFMPKVQAGSPAAVFGGHRREAPPPYLSGRANSLSRVSRKCKCSSPAPQSCLCEKSLYTSVNRAEWGRRCVRSPAMVRCEVSPILVARKFA